MKFILSGGVGGGAEFQQQFSQNVLECCFYEFLSAKHSSGVDYV